MIEAFTELDKYFQISTLRFTCIQQFVEMTMLMIRYYISDENKDNDDDDSRANDKIGLIRVVMEVLVVMVMRWLFL